MSEISQTIDAVIELLRPVMKQQGFAKSGRTWRRPREGCVQVVNVQASSWNSSERGAFTVNLGVYFPAVAELAGDPVRSAPSEPYCQLHQRIGFLMPNPGDFWWEVRPGSSLLEVADELAAAVTSLAIPWLDAHSTYAAALDSARCPATGPYGLHEVALCLLLGREEEASARLAEGAARLAGMGHVEAAERWLAWGREHGVVVA